jgi:hypothetical protein
VFIYFGIEDAKARAEQKASKNWVLRFWNCVFRVEEGTLDTCILTSTDPVSWHFLCSLENIEGICGLLVETMVDLKLIEFNQVRFVFCNHGQSNADCGEQILHPIIMFSSNKARSYEFNS